MTVWYDNMTEVSVIGDELYFNGEVVAILAQRGVTPTALQLFTDHIEAGTLFEANPTASEGCQKAGCAHLKECPMHDQEVGTQRPFKDEHEDREALLAILEKHAKNGLLRVQDACMLVNKYFDGEA